MTDQAGRVRANTTNALDRLVPVVEDPSGKHWYTYYRSPRVCPAGLQPRSFNYDSLSRLSSATNPESGNVTYSSYDGNGNLLTKTDARNVVTSFSYDLLIRITLKNYAVAGSVAPTDSVTYCYDGQVADASDGACTTPASAIAYGWNHLTEVRTAPSTTAYGS